MLRVAGDVFLLDGFPRAAINVYLIGDVLVDAGTRHAWRRIARQITGRPLTAHALTHAHADHQGASHRICTTRDIPLLCPASEADAMESGELAPLGPDNVVTRWALRHWAGPAHPVARRLREGDEVGGFTVLETPGHSPGHLSYWREDDRALILGDVLLGSDPYTGRPALHPPPDGFTLDPARNRESARRIAALEPAVVCFGHGPPWRDPDGLRAFVERL